MCSSAFAAARSHASRAPVTSGILKQGRGNPRTLFAPGGEGDELATRMRFAHRVKGTRIGFAYEGSGHFEEVRHLRRQADRDAAEVRAVSDEHRTTRAIGFSRGARAIVGALAENPSLFERIVLAIPPGATVSGKYSPWLESLTIGDRGELTSEILVIGDQLDRGHPSQVAETWATQLGARFELLPPRTIYDDEERVLDLIAGFLNR